MGDSSSTAAAGLAAVLRHVQAVAWTTDRDLRLTSMHGALVERLRGQASIGRRLDDFVDDAAAIEAHRVALEGGIATYRYELAGISWTVTVEPLPGGDGELPGCVAVAVDTTAPQSRERQLVEAQERLTALAENVPLTVYTATLDRSPRPRYISGGIEELLGVPARQFTFDQLRAAVHPDDRERVLSAMDEADRKALPLEIEYRIVDRAGRTRWIEDSSTVVSIAGEQLAQGYLLDIDDRKATEEHLHRRVATRRRLAEIGRRALEGAPLGALVDEALSVLDDGIDATAGSYLELEGDALVVREAFGWTARDAVALPSSPAGIAAATGETLFANDVPEEEADEASLRRRLGVRSSIAAPLVVDGRVHGVVSVHSGRTGAFDESDVSLVEQIANLLAAAVSRDRAAEERRDVERQLVHTQRLEAVGQLAAGVAHDFNNLLTAIGGYTELARAAVDERTARYLDQVLAASERAGELTAQLLAFSRKQLLAPQHVSTRQLVEAVVPVLRPLLRERIELQVELSDDAPVVFVDPARLENVLLNLAVNARDAMPDGGTLTIATGGIVLDLAGAAEHDVLPGEYATLTLSDTGTGMSRDVLEKVFEPFFTTKQLGEGTGLGLSSVYGSVRQSGGFVTVASEPGVGTEFRIALPAGDGAVTAPADAGAPVARRGSGSESVLVVEDDPAVRDVVLSWLAEIGYQAAGSATAESALAELASQSYDLVLADAQLGGLSGVELVARLPELAPGTRCLLMSGYARELLVADDDADLPPVLLKPFTLAALATAVEEQLSVPAV